MAKPGLKRPAKAKPKPTPGPKATKRPAKAEQGAKNPKAPSLRGVVSSLSKAIDLKSRSLKVLYLLRGAPGCGKSSVARLLLQKHLKAQGVSWNASSAGAAHSPICRAFICSTDDYFTIVDSDGGAEYEFHAKRLRELHERNKERCGDAMRLSRTPLFVDNTNMALWEMSAYVALAEQHGYDVMIIGPEQLGDVGLPVLLQRCQDSVRTSGKEIGQDVLERMLSRYEKLPDGIQGVLWASCAPELAAVRDAKPAPRYRYAGLDVEKQALEALAAIDLGPLFWEGIETTPEQRHLSAARSRDLWRHPDRLHVTVQYFGKDVSRQEAEQLVGKSFPVKVTGLVFLRGGGLMCSTCEFAPEDYAVLAKLAGEEWRPHITLLFSHPWRAQHSNDLLKALEEAVTKAAMQDPAVNSADTQVEETQLDPMSQEVETQVPALPQALPPPGLVPHAEGTLQVLDKLQLRDQVVDICALQLRQPRDLGRCLFQLFS